MRILHFDNIPWDDFSHQAFGRVLHSKLFGHQMVWVQGVDGELDENRTRGSRLSDCQGLPECGHDLPDCSDGGAELTQRLEERHLVDVLQCSSALRQKEKLFISRVKARSIWHQPNTLLLPDHTQHVMLVNNPPVVMYQQLHLGAAEEIQPFGHSSQQLQCW